MSGARVRGYIARARTTLSNNYGSSGFHVKDGNRKATITIGTRGVARGVAPRKKRGRNISPTKAETHFCTTDGETRTGE